MAIARQTWDQVQIKADMGLFRGMRTFQIKFHWKFWAPLDAIGGKIYFGSYGEYDDEELSERDRVAKRTEEALRGFIDRLRSGEPIKATRVTIEQTPDGPLTTVEDVVI